MNATVQRPRGELAPGTRARGAARANLAGSLAMVWACYGAPGSVLLTLFLQDWLRADKWQIGLVMTMTFLGPVFEPVGAYLAERLGCRRRLFLSTFLFNRLPFLALAIVPFLGPPETCRRSGIALVLAVVAITRLPASLGTPAWWSWMADLVPERRRGRFFGWRTQMASTVSALSFIAGMSLLQTCGGIQNRVLVSALFAVGACFGVADIVLYFWVPEPSPSGGRAAPSQQRRGGFRRDFSKPFKLPAFRRLIFGMGLWSFSANLAMPFLPVYQNGEVLGGQPLGLGLSWFFLAILNVAGGIGGMLTSRWWARCGDRLGTRLLIYLGSGYLFVNLTYLFVGPGRWLGLLPPVALISGALNAAWTVGVNQLLLAVAPRKKRSFYVSAYNCTNGCLMAGGPILGGLLADRLPVMGWHLPGAVPCCYFHLLLILAVVGGFAALTILWGVPAAGPVRRTGRLETNRVWLGRVRVFLVPSSVERAKAQAMDNAKEYATI